MGTIDSLTITLTCPQCTRTESARILDKGSTWSGSHWQVPSFRSFEAVVTGGGKQEPEVTATCPECEVAAKVSERYGT